jgi:hypothetical protein
MEEGLFVRNAVEVVGRVLSDALSDAAAATAESSLVKSPPLIKTVAAINARTAITINAGVIKRALGCC